MPLEKDLQRDSCQVDRIRKSPSCIQLLQSKSIGALERRVVAFNAFPLTTRGGCLSQAHWVDRPVLWVD